MATALMAMDLDWDEKRRKSAASVTYPTSPLVDPAAPLVVGQHELLRVASSPVEALERPKATQPAKPDTSAKPIARPHFPCLDGLRACAALAVLFLHTSFYSGFMAKSGAGGYIGRLEIGVSVFFLMSGFLLYRPFAAAHLAGRPPPAITSFMKRRLLRMVPAYWLALTVMVYVLHTVPLRGGWQGVAANYGFAFIYFPSQVFSSLGPAWSICTEMSFYVFLPFYALSVSFPRGQTSGQLRRELTGIVILIGISFQFRSWHLNQPICAVKDCFTSPTRASLMSSWMPSYLDLFALGIFLAVMSAWFSQNQSEPAWLRHRMVPWTSWSIAAVLFYWVNHLGIPDTPLYIISVQTNLLKQTLYGAFAFAVLVPAVFGPQDRGLIRRLLRLWPLSALGVVSYGVYLWHSAFIVEYPKWTHSKPFNLPLWPILLVTLIATIAAASASYFMVELPILKLKDRRLEIRPSWLARRTRGAHGTHGGRDSSARAAVAGRGQVGGE